MRGARFRRAVILASLVIPFAAAIREARAQNSEKEGEENALEVTPSQLLSQAELPYPQGGEGSADVALKLLVNLQGEVAEVQVIEGQEPFTSAARKAALTLEFRPATVGGEARAAWVLYRVVFEPPVIEPEPKPVMRSSNCAKLYSKPSEEEFVEQEVTVTGIRRPGVGRVISDAETQVIPGAEGDPVRSIEAMPGTVPILASGPFLGLRGASPGMVGYQYDGIELPYLFHLARGPAVVHPWIVSSASLHSGGAPARLGRALGGFVEASSALPEGRRRLAARIRLTDSAVGAEAPFADGRGSVLVAGRYSYTRPLVSLIAPKFSLDFWDYQSRIRYALTEKDHLEVLAFGAGDRSSVLLPDESREDLFHGSLHRAAIRYTRRRRNGVQHQISATVGHDRWDGNQSPIQPFLYIVQLRGTSAQPVSRRSWIEAGVEAGVRSQTDYYYNLATNSEQVVQYRRDDVAASTWLDWTFLASKATTMALGMRADLYSSTESDLHDTATHGAVQPRFSLFHAVTENIRLHHSLGLLSQPRSPAQRPPGRLFSVDGGLEWGALADAGVEFKLPAGFNFDTTVFHNTFFNVGDIEHLRFVDGQNRSEDRGQGRALGAEFSLRRMLGHRLRGFISYTLSRSERSIGRVRGLAEFDRPHVLDIALAYDFERGWSLTSRGTYYRGYLANVSRVAHVRHSPRASDHYQIDWQVAKRWDLNDYGGWWGFTVGILNSNLRSEVNDFFCNPELRCTEDLVGPATVPTFGVEGEL